MSKTSKRAMRAARNLKSNQAPQPKDDGTRWVVIGENGRKIYLGIGVPKAEAERLSFGLVSTTSIKEVEPVEV